MNADSFQSGMMAGDSKLILSSWQKAKPWVWQSGQNESESCSNFRNKTGQNIHAGKCEN